VTHNDDDLCAEGWENHVFLKKKLSSDQGVESMFSRCSSKLRSDVPHNDNDLCAEGIANRAFPKKSF